MELPLSMAIVMLITLQHSRNVGIATSLGQVITSKLVRRISMATIRELMASVAFRTIASRQIIGSSQLCMASCSLMARMQIRWRTKKRKR